MEKEFMTQDELFRLQHKQKEELLSFEKEKELTAYDKYVINKQMELDKSRRIKKRTDGYLRNRIYPSYKEAIIIVRSLGIMSSGHYKELYRNSTLLEQLPSDSYLPTVYKDNWISWSDFLGVEIRMGVKKKWSI